MKKILVVLFIPFLLISCGEDHEESISVDPLVNVLEKLSKYELVGDVKQAERIFYDNARWDPVSESIIKYLPTGKEVYIFDKNGVLIKKEWYRFGLTNGADDFILSQEILYSYDSKYRMTEYFMKSYSSFVRKTVHIYDDINKIVTIINYSGYNEDLHPIDKTIHSLDENGWIDDKYIEYYEPKSLKAVDETQIHKSKLVRGKDQKRIL